MTPALHKIWCDEDEHTRYAHFADFNECLDGEEGQTARIDYGVDALPPATQRRGQPEKMAKIEILPTEPPSAAGGAGGLPGATAGG